MGANVAPLTRRLVLAAALLVGVIAAGTVGYRIVCGFSWFDSLYMTVISITTVGYGEVHPLNNQGKLLTIFVVLAGAGAGAYVAGSLIAFFVEGEMADILRGRQMERQIAALKDHFILCGYGISGSQTAMEFSLARRPFVVLEIDPEGYERAKADGRLVVHGDAEEDTVLERAGVRRARGLASVLDTDAKNVFTVLTARTLNPDMTIVARAVSKASEAKLLKAGADKVIAPRALAGRRMARMLLRPTVMDFLDVVMAGEDLSFEMMDAEIAAGSELVGVTLRDSPIREKTRAIIVGIKALDGSIAVNPDPNTHLAAGDRLIALGSVGQIDRLLELAGAQSAIG